MKNYFMSIPESIMIKQIFMEIEQINEVTLEYNLKLSEEDMNMIIKGRNEALTSNGRVEFGGEIISKIITMFCDSPYIIQTNYVEIVDDLIKTFYYYKNETEEKISDDELLMFMKECFDNSCQGDISLLRYNLGIVEYNIKHGVTDYFNIDGEEEKEEF